MNATPDRDQIDHVETVRSPNAYGHIVHYSDGYQRFVPSALDDGDPR
ncbi:hypothetical protein [Rhodococcus sp. P1Y]|nr:hypothetical protein [Rhodococcus sp. P1Y]